MSSAALALVPASNADAVEFIRQQEGDSYGFHVRAFTDWLDDRDLDRSAVVDYFSELNASNYAAQTKRVKRQALKKRLRQLGRANGLGSDLSENIETFLRDLDREGPTKAPTVVTAPVTSGKVLSDDECRRVVEAATPKQAMLIRFLLATGCRVSEMIGIRIQDCTFNGDRIDIRITGKGNKERHVRIPGTLFDAINSTYFGSEYLFESAGHKQLNRNSVSNTIAALTSRILNHKVRAHALRHTFATRFVSRHPAKIEALSKYLGHSSVAITLSYYVHDDVTDGDLDALDLFSAEPEL